MTSRFMGLRQPKPKSENYIYRFIKRKELNINRVLVFSDTFMIRGIISRSAKDLIFLSDGSQVNKDAEKDSPNCSSNGIDFINTFQKGKKYPTIANSNWDKEQSRWKQLDGGKYEKTSSSNYDLNIVYYWGSYIGRPNLKNRIDKIQELIKSRPDLSINFILVNVDLRKGVDMGYESLIIEKMMKEGKLNSKVLKIK
jgi:hypothetical protein